MGKHKKHHNSLGGIALIDWSGLLLAIFVVAGFTAYAFFVSLGSSRIVLDSAPQEPLALVAIAVANNVGTGSSRSSEIPVISPEDVVIAGGAVVRDAMDEEVFFSEHFQQLSAFEELARIDIPTYLDGKVNKQEALENYIEELAKYSEQAQATVQSLNSQALFHKNSLQSAQSDIKTTQAQIETSYKDRDSTGIMDNIADLDEFVLVHQDHRYGQIFAEQMSKEYQSVIQFSNNKLQVIKANIPALVQGVTVNLPKGNQVVDLEQLQIFSRETN